MKKKWKSEIWKGLGNLFLVLLISTSNFYVNAATPQGRKDLLVIKNGSIESIFNQIREQSNLEFFYNASSLDVSRQISLAQSRGKLEDILKEVLGKGYSYEIKDNYVLIYRQDKMQSQQVKSVLVRGVVVDDKKMPLPGVTVRVMGTQMGTTTNAKGEFKIKLPVTHVDLVFSFIGYSSQIVVIDEKFKGDPLSVMLKEKVQSMDEVVVTGYGNVSKANYTGASTTVKAEDIMMPGVSSIDQMLQGVVPGMLVTNTTGQVGASTKIRVRGTSTLLGNQEPVWVVDGVVQRDPQPFNSDENLKFSVDADDIKQLAGNAISWLNPSDIESITVLKDASATAIYGSKAANGVIVVTTKKAKVGKISVNYSGDFSIGQRPHYGLYDLMNSAERMELSKNIYEERRQFPGGNTQLLPVGYEGLLYRLFKKEITLDEMNKEYKRMSQENTDWFGTLFENSFNHSHIIGISGGSDKVQNRTSFGYSKQNGEAKGNDMTSFTATSNTTVSLWDKVRIAMSLKGSVRDVKGFAYGVDLFNYAYNTSRVIPTYNEDGSYYFHEKYGKGSPISGTRIYNYNILNELENTGSRNTTRTWGTTFDLKWNILPGLEYQGLVSYSASSSDSKRFATEKSYYISQIRGYEFGTYAPNSDEEKMSPLPMGGVLATDLTNVNTVTVRNSLVYNRLFKEKHRLTLQIGLETNSTKTRGESNERYGYMPDRGEMFAQVPATYIQSNHPTDNDLKQAAVTVLNRTNNELSEYASAIYAYDDRYIINLSGRVDASNRFGQDKNKRFQPTWSAGFKWRATQEHFLSGLDWLNNFDLYGSYGYQGNAVTSVSPDLIATSQFVNQFNRFGLVIKSLPYPDLGWEKTETYNLGMNASFLSGRMNFTFNYFMKKSSVLASRELAYENGMANGIVSGTTMKNDGYDFVINFVPVSLEDFKWQLSLNTSVTNNSVEKNERINTLNDYIAGSAVVDGKSFSTFYSYQFDGLEQEYGQPLFKNLDKTDAETPADILVESGKFTPDFSGGLNTMFKYKNLSLYALFAIQWGGHRRLPAIYPVDNGYKGLPNPSYNASKKLLARWRKAGDVTDIPSLPGIGTEEVIVPKTLTSRQVYKNRYELYNNSNLMVANTDFIRCRSISLGYDFGDKALKKMRLQHLQLKFSMTNPFMWARDSKWDGLDPETGNWPARRVSSFSIQMMF